MSWPNVRASFVRGDHVRSSTFPGVALWFVETPAADCGHSAIGEYCECEPEPDTDAAVVVMVGDDVRHRVPAGSLTVLDEDDFCGGCGQIGCGHGG